MWAGARRRGVLFSYAAVMSAVSPVARTTWSRRHQAPALSDLLLTTDFDETVSYVYDFMQKNGPFDGIMGFSQGACMAAVLGALVSQRG